MNAKHYSLLQLSNPDKLVREYLLKNEALAPLISAFPEIENFERSIAERSFDNKRRSILTNVLLEQYEGLNTSTQVKESIQALESENTYTVTTGHQLCLFTGPLYFVYKIISTIRLAEELSNRYPEKKIVPVYWMATEDHDFAEINHAYFFGKKLEWQTDQKGAVGNMNTQGINEVIDELEKLLGNAPDIIEMLRTAYSHDTLASATRFLVNELFGRYGLVVIDGNHRQLKSQFKEVIHNELFQQNGYRSITSTNEYLKSLDFKAQVNPREINLFYLEGNLRARIEQKDENNWSVVDTDKSFTASELEKLIEEQPEVFSPNVVLRPLYQETLLPNLAYVGGPGELAYWLQLKGFFTQEKIAFPVLVLRDSALLLNTKSLQKLEKLGLTASDLFNDSQATIKRLVNSTDASLEEEKNQLRLLFESLAAKLKAIDSTLEGAALAEAQKQITAIEHLEKKALKALKTKEENKINQFQKLLGECFPDGTPQERHDNIFQHISTLGDTLIDELSKAFNPLEQRYHILEQEAVLH